MNGMNLLPEDIFTVFRRLGFAKYEAKVYAALCACGSLKMGQLAKYSMVPQSKIYGVIESLEEKGAVTVSTVRPLTVESVPMKEIVSMRFRKYLSDTRKVSVYIESIQNTRVFEHLYLTHRIALRSGGFSPP